MNRLIFSLADNSVLLDGVADEEIRATVQNFSENEQIEQIINILLQTNKINSLARITYNYINNITNVSINFEENEEFLDLQNFLLDLPITSFLCLISSSSDTALNVSRFSFGHGSDLRTFRNASELSAAFQSEGLTMTEETYWNCYNSLEILEQIANMNIILHSAIDRENQPLHCWNCTAPGCQASGLSIEEYKAHIEECHNDEFATIDPIWADIFRHMRLSGNPPTVREFFKPTFIGGLYITKEEELRFHVFIDKHKYDKSVENASKMADHNLITYDTKTLDPIMLIKIDMEGPLGRLITNLAGEKEVVDFGEVETTTLDDVIFRDHIISDFIVECEGLEIEESITFGNGRITVTENNYQEFIRVVTDKVKALNLKTDVQALIDFFLEQDFDERLCQSILSDSNTPIIIAIFARHKWLPGPGLSSPYPGNNTIFPKIQGLSSHIQKTEGAISTYVSDKTAQYLSAAVDKAFTFTTNLDGSPDINDPITFCPYFDCNFACHKGKNLHAHANSGIHTEDRQTLAELGPFWNSQACFAKHQNELAKIALIERDITILKCNLCGSSHVRFEDLKNHIISKHKIAATAINDTSYCRCDTVRLSRDDIRAVKTNLDNEQRLALVRPLNEQTATNTDTTNTNTDNTNNTQDTNPTNATAENNNNIAPNPTNTDNTNASNPDEEEIVQETVQAELVNIVLDSRNEVSNDDLVTIAREWINNYKQEEESMLGLPNMNPERRKHIKKNLAALYNLTIIPLLEKFMPTNSSDDEKVKLDGVVYKINHELREHCRRQLNITRQQMMNPRHASQERIDSDREARKKEITNYTKLSALSSDSSKMAKLLTEMRDLRNNSSRGQVHENRFNHLKSKAVTIFNNMDEEWRKGVLGNNTFTSIDDLMTTQEDQFERTIKWLQSKIDETNVNIKSGITKIRNMYEDNQRKCLDHYVWPKTTPACPLTATDFENHYGREWANEVSHYENPIENGEWNIDKTIGDNADTRLLQFMSNEKAILEIISSRNHLSAHGRDGLSNALFRLAKNESGKMFALLHKAILTCRHVPDSWKNTKTVMLYKKDDPSIPKNWRPIGLTSTMYRIFAATLSKWIISENKLNPVFHPSQKGFIGGGNGAQEHINKLNELIHHVKRHEYKAVLVTIDLTNAFGSVPHQLMFDTLARKGFPSAFLETIEDIYTDNFTRIDVNGASSNQIPTKRGVLQGCPLSPLLFNSCIDPLLTHLERYRRGEGVSFTWKELSYTITAQAYADDIVLVANSKESADKMIEDLQAYCHMTGLTIAPKKCIAITEGYDNIDIKIEGVNIPVLQTNDAISYLGAPISGRKSSKIKFTRKIVDDIKNKIKLVFNSPLSLNQKIHATKTYILPKIDYCLTNSTCRMEDLRSTDAFIRGRIMDDLKCARIPKELAHLNGKNGGLGIPSLEFKANKLKILNFITPLLSKKEDIRAFAELCLEEEISRRGIERGHPESPFFDFGFTGVSGERLSQLNPHRATSCNLSRAIEGCKSADIALKIDEKNNFYLKALDEEWTIPNAKAAKTVLDNIQQKDLLERIRRNVAHGHSFTGTTTKASHAYRGAHATSNKLFSFLIKARTNTLPTGANKMNWFPNTEGKCPSCGSLETLNHILNKCQPNSTKIKWRHNLVAQRITDEITNTLKPSIIKQSCRLEVNDLSAANKSLLPDIHAIFEDQNKVIIIEVTIPYNQEENTNGHLTNTLKSRQEAKKNKYESLVHEVAALTGFETLYYTVVVSSLGHVTEETEGNLIELFGNKKGKKLAEQISLDAIIGSACIYHNKPPEEFGYTTSLPWPVNIEDNNDSHSNNGGVASNDDNQSNEVNTTAAATNVQQPNTTRTRTTPQPNDTQQNPPNATQTRTPPQPNETQQNSPNATQTGTPPQPNETQQNSPNTGTPPQPNETQQNSPNATRPQQTNNPAANSQTNEPPDQPIDLNEHIA